MAEKPVVNANSDLSEIPNELIDLSTAARIVGVTPQTLRRMEGRGKISGKRTASGHRRFFTHDVIRLARSVPEEVYRSGVQDRLSPSDLAKAITGDDAARLLGVSRPTLRRWEREGKIKSMPGRQGRKSLYNRESIEALANLGE
ncbi:helix-turn-helix DNA binding domain protein [Rhodococcus phage MacGully]|nr:helix-turn-helix DNA binding domain protein [Rhodococcus phage MacGully]